MKICFCIKSMANPGGGAERVLTEVTRALCDRKHDVTLVTFDVPGRSSFYPLHEGIRRVGLGVGLTNRPATPLATMRRIARLRGEISRQSPDVAVGFMHSMYIPLGIAALGSGIPVIGSEHQAAEHYRNRPIHRLLLRAAPLLLARMTCVSDQARDAFPGSIRQIMVPIANPIALRAGGKADAEGRAPRVLLAVGRLDPQKAFQILVEAFAGIATMVPDWNLRIVGEGQEREPLSHLVESLGLSNRVQMPGAVTDISREYLGAQLFVVPSRYESFGMATAEALAHGLPAVGFEDCPGTNRLIKPGINGALAPAAVDRASSLARTLLPLMLDPGARTRLSINPPSTDKEFDVESVAGRWEELVLQVVRKG